MIKQLYNKIFNIKTKETKTYGWYFCDSDMKNEDGSKLEIGKTQTNEKQFLHLNKVKGNTKPLDLLRAGDGMPRWSHYSIVPPQILANGPLAFWCEFEEDIKIIDREKQKHKPDFYRWDIKSKKRTPIVGGDITDILIELVREVINDTMDIDPKLKTFKDVILSKWYSTGLYNAEDRSSGLGFICNGCKSGVINQYNDIFNFKLNYCGINNYGVTNFEMENLIHLCLFRQMDLVFHDGAGPDYKEQYKKYNLIFESLLKNKFGIN